MLKSRIKEWVSDRADCLILDVITTAVKAYYTKYKGLQTMETHATTKYGRVIIKTARWLKDYKRQQDQEPCRGNVYLTREAYAELCYKAAKWNESEECGDAIDRKEAIKAVYQICSTELGRWKENPHIDAVIDVLENLPTVRPSCRCQQIDKTESEE